MELLSFSNSKHIIPKSLNERGICNMSKANLELELVELTALKKLANIALLAYQTEEEHFKQVKLESSEDYQNVLDSSIERELHEKLVEKISQAILTI